MPCASRSLLFTTLLAAVTLHPLTSRGQVPDAPGSMRRELIEPFSYFLIPSDVLGFKDSPEGTQVTHDGAFNTGFGEFDVFIGKTPTPMNQRIKTLLRGHLPILQYSCEHDGLHYSVEAFAAPLELSPFDLLINFIRITVTNAGSSSRFGGLGVGFHPLHGQGRHPLTCQPWYRAQFMDRERLATGPVSFQHDGAWRSNHLIYTFSAPDASRERTPADGGPQLHWRFKLKPGTSRAFDFKVPYVPLARHHTQRLTRLRAAQYDDYRDRVITFWTRLLDRATSINLPEDKVADTFKAGLIYDLIARDITEDGRFIQKVNEFQYDSFYPRDAAYIARSYDLLGLHDIARETIAHFFEPDHGAPTALKRLMPDDWGQSLWAVAQHIRFTADVAYAHSVFPAISAHIAAFERACADDPWGLWPATGPYDNEAITGHYTGHSFWALLGLDEAIYLARLTGREDDARRWQSIRDGYMSRFTTRLDAVTAQTGGYIPPGLEDPLAGCDWANASGGVYPFGVFEAFDHRVTATVNTIRTFKYREGIMTYGPNAWAVRDLVRRNQPADPGWLHHYETFYVDQTLLARGEQRAVIEDLYAILAHTSSTHAGFEYSIRPWSDRDPGANRPPHGWFAARYNELLRNMFVREEGTDLHLLSAISPKWISMAPGAQSTSIRVERAATRFGPLSYHIETTPESLKITLDAEWHTPPELIRLHIPWFKELDNVQSLKRVDHVGLDPAQPIHQFAWRTIETPTLDYDTAVRLFLEKYYDRQPTFDYDYLFPTPRPPTLLGSAGSFIENTELTLIAPGLPGTIRFTLDGTPVTAESPRYSQPVSLSDSTTLRARTYYADGRKSPELFTIVRRVEPLAGVELKDAQPGLTYEYYEGAWSQLPDFSTLTSLRSGTMATIDLSVIKPAADDFAVRIRGYINIPETGVYRFYTTSDDGSMLWVHGHLVVNNDGLHGSQMQGGEIALAHGRHPIEVTFFEHLGAARLTVEYAKAGGPRQPLPRDALFHQP